MKIFLESVFRVDWRIEKENCRNKLACLGQMSGSETGKEQYERHCKSTLLKEYRSGKSIHGSCHSPL